MPTLDRPHLRRGFSLVAALALSWSSLALAAPAVIKRQTEARSAPFVVAPLVEDLIAGTKLSADETASNGWRRVQLPSGKFGFVHDDDVAVDLSHAAAPPPSPASGAPAPAAPASTEAPAAAPSAPAADAVQPLPTARTGRAPQYVGDLGHLAELVKSDPQVFDLATSLDVESKAAWTSAFVGVLGGSLLLFLSDSALKTTTCVQGICASERNVKLNDIGTALLLVGPLVGFALHPTHADRTKVINEWNNRHPDRPFIDSGGVQTPQ